jgi:hypothetical protein
MDNGLSSTLFRSDSIIVERRDKLIPLQWNICEGCQFSTAAGVYSGRLRDLATVIAVFSVQIAVFSPICCF